MLKRLFFLAFLVPTLFTLGAQAAYADVLEISDREGRITLVEVGSESSGSSSGSSSSGGTESARVCTFNDSAIPCEKDGAAWSTSYGCYLSRLNPQPPRDDPAWNGRTDGAIYLCGGGYAGSLPASPIWLPGAPELPPPDPETLAWRALTQIQLQAPDIRMFPAPTSQDPESMTIIGFPVAAWADTTTGQLTPLHSSASERGYTVSLTATLNHTTWDFGDGSPPITCHGPGTPFHGQTISPTTTVPCGRQDGYQQQGEFTATATAHWQVRWQGIGRSGTIQQQMTSTETLLVGEYQVLNVTPPN